MPVDPRHGRHVPSGTALAELVRQMFHVFQTQAINDLAHGEIWDPSKIDINVYADRAFPIMLEEYQRGAYAMEEELRGRRLGKHANSTISKANGISAFFNVFNREVIEQVWNMTMNFVTSTLATAATHVANVYEEVRGNLADALKGGESSKKISERMREIFSNPDKAFAIGQSESSRAMHAGQNQVAKDAGFKTKSWMASSDACDFCLKLDALGPVPIDKPFIVLSKGNPAYRTIMFPPGHVHCVCSMSFDQD